MIIYFMLCQVLLMPDLSLKNQPNPLFLNLKIYLAFKYLLFAIQDFVNPAGKRFENLSRLFCK